MKYRSPTVFDHIRSVPLNRTWSRRGAVCTTSRLPPSHLFGSPGGPHRGPAPPPQWI